MESALNTILGDSLTKATAILGGPAGEFVVYGLALIVIGAIVWGALWIISFVRNRKG